MKRSRLFDILLWVLACLPLAGAALVYPYLPAQIPVHWGFDGTADGFGPKASIFFTAALAVGLQLLMAALPHLDPRGTNYARFARAYRALRLVLALFGIGLTAVQAASAWPGSQLNTTGLVTAGIGLMLAAFGNYMPKIRPNFMCGIRTPWTLASESVWRKTHRLAGPLWVAGGAIMVLGGLFARGAVLGVATVVCCLALAVPVAASFFYFRREQSAGK